jgi:hypothetical protein
MAYDRCPNCGKYTWGVCKCKPFECWNKEWGQDDHNFISARTPQDAAIELAELIDSGSEITQEQEIVVIVDGEEKTFKVYGEYVPEYWVV